jgi:protoporphyrinogen/coproporphyrinogen III oxidase
MYVEGRCVYDRRHEFERSRHGTVTGPTSSGFLMDDVDVMVVGGGISGLSAARELCGRGLRVRLLEREVRCGGVIRTDRQDSFVVDPGPDTLLTRKPAALALCRDLGIEASLVAPAACRTTYVVRDGTLRPLSDTSAFGLPTDWRVLATTRAFSWRGKLRMAAEPVIPRSTTTSDESITSFVQRRFGREAVTYLAEPLLAGLHRGDPGQLSMRALFPAFIDAEQRHGSVVRALRRTSGTGGGGSMSLRAGLAELVDRLRISLPPDVVETGADVRGIQSNGSFVAELSGRRITARAVILATPLYTTANLVRGLDRELAELCEHVRYASCVTVALGYNASAVQDPLRGWGFVVPARERRRIAAASWVSSKWPDRAPTGHVLIRVSLGGARDPAAIDQTDATLIAWADSDLAELLRISASPVMARVYRWPSAMPQLEVGHRERVAAIERQLTNTPGLFMTASGMRGVGISDCIEDARRHAQRAAEHLLTAV